MPFITIILFGALASGFALIFELILQIPVTLANQSIELSLLTAFSLFSLALIEEASKYLFLRQYSVQYFRTIALERRNIILLGILFGIGFSLLELALSIQNDVVVTFFPIFGRTILHVSTSIIFAYFIFRSSAILTFSKVFRLILAMALIHFAYNLSLLLFT